MVLLASSTRFSWVNESLPDFRVGFKPHSFWDDFCFSKNLSSEGICGGERKTLVRNSHLLGV